MLLPTPSCEKPSPTEGQHRRQSRIVLCERFSRCCRSAVSTAARLRVTPANPQVARRKLLSCTSFKTMPSFSALLKPLTASSVRVAVEVVVSDDDMAAALNQQIVLEAFPEGVARDGDAACQSVMWTLS